VKITQQRRALLRRAACARKLLVDYNRCRPRNRTESSGASVVAAVTALLVYGIRESARTNTTIVIIKIAVVMFVIAFGAFLVHQHNLCATAN